MTVWCKYCNALAMIEDTSYFIDADGTEWPEDSYQYSEALQTEGSKIRQKLKLPKDWTFSDDTVEAVLENLQANGETGAFCNVCCALHGM